MRTLCLVSLLTIPILSFLLSALPAQGPLEPEIPPGFVLVDDMVVPDVDSGFTATAWTGGVVPYVFHSNVSTANRTLAVNAMAEWEAVADVTFVPRNGEANYIRFVDSTGNNSLVGMNGGRQDVNLFNWGTRYIICHELYHALGFKHEQSRPDRGQFVTINTPNISQTACSGGPCNSNFNIDNTITTVGPYDFQSIMHYDDFAFSANGQPTITCNAGFTQFQTQIGQRTFMTVLDAEGLAFRYGPPSAPTLATLSRTWAVTGDPSFTLTVTGALFFQGSPNGSGVQGTRVQWNGVDLPTTFVSPTQLQATVDTSRLVGGCHRITVNNAYPGGGVSNELTFSVGPAGTWPKAWNGSEAFNHLGAAVACIGDANRDGYDDVLIGEPEYDADRGRLWCCSGYDGAVLWSSTGALGDELGSAIARIGDVTGDGIGDALVGAPGYLSDRGRASTVNGATGVTIRTYLGGVAGDRFGAAVANAGDLNGDGTPDGLIGAPGYAGETGRVFVIDGAWGPTLRTLDGENAGDQFGYAVAGGLVVSGTVPSIVVGAPFHDFNGNDRGKAYLFDGGTGVQLAAKLGDGADDRLGIAVALTPPLFGATSATVLVGADEWGSSWHGGLAEEGYVKLLGIPANPPAGSLYQTLATIDGRGLADQFGFAVSYAGDIDQDGIADLLVGAPQTASISVGAGYVQVLSGANLEVIHESAGEGEGDGYGKALAFVGNTDGDSRPDFVVGAPYDDLGACINVGRVSVRSPLYPTSHRKVMISEVTWGEPDAVEITNFAFETADLTGWTLRWSGNTILVSTPLNISLIRGESAVVKEPGPGFPETPAAVQVLDALPPISTTGGAITVALVDPWGQVADEVRISNVNGGHHDRNLGGFFRGLAVRGVLSSQNGSSGCVERIWGLDSNSGGDWTDEVATSMGLENRNSGPRGTDPVAAFDVVINELDTNPDFVEFRLRSGGLFGIISVQNWYVAASPGQGIPHTIIRPWPSQHFVGEFFVIGDGAPPAELPAGIDYVSVGTPLADLPWNNEEFDCALYDSYGRLIDIVRTTGHDDVCVHNHLRAPSLWSDFVGAAGRDANGGDQAIGRAPQSADTNTGADFAPIQTRSMGSPNPAASRSGPPGHGDSLDVRLNETALGEGLVVILNAGPTHAGHKWSLALSAGHLQGQGALLGLAPSALVNWVALYNDPVFSGFLDAQGSARVDLPPASLPPGVEADLIFLLQDGTGTVVAITRVLEFDT